MRAELLLKVCVLFILALLGGFGCGSKTTFKELDPTAKHLKKIGWAYIQATDELGYAPQKKDDIIPFLLPRDDNNDEDPEKADKTEKPATTFDPAEVFRSSRDSEDFVILWGVDYRQYRLSGKPETVPVLGYEKYGQDGSRYVLQFRYVTLKTDEELSQLPFPMGFRAP